MTEQVCRRLQFLRQKLIDDLHAGEKIFVFKNLQRNLTETELVRLHAAVRAYGNGVLLYVQYADEAYPAGAVEDRGDGLMIGYIEHFAFSPEDKKLGPVNDAWSDLCNSANQILQGMKVREAARHEPPSGRKVTPKARHIVLIGNCQINAMGQMYRRFVAGRTGDTVEHIPTYRELTPEHRAAIERADVVVEQLFDLEQQADITMLPTTTPRLFVPMVTAAFLWPFAGSPHPKNTGYQFLIGGPYGGEAADSYLNRLILAGTAPEEAVEIYVNLDVNERVNLDRLFELVMDRQRTRDAASGYQIADIIEQHFRTEQIFLSPYHPNVRIATALAAKFFEQLGGTAEEIERMRHCTRTTPFPKGELPFHPSVCRHFGLDFVAPDRRYRFMNEGLFTFREYALRYMRYEWNEALEEGMHLVHLRKMEEARPRLMVGLERSPLSAAGHNALSHIHASQDARDDAIASIRRAVEIEPSMASYHMHLGGLLQRAGQLEPALTAMQAGVAIDPVEPHHHVLVAHLLRQQGDMVAARRHVQEAVGLDPYSPKLLAELAEFRDDQADVSPSLAAVRAAIAQSQEDLPLRHRLIHMLREMGRLPEAIEAAQAAVAVGPKAARTHTILSDLMLRRGDEVAALSEAHLAAECEPGSGHAYAHLGHVLRVTGDFPAAEAALRRAYELEPLNAHVRHQMSVLLDQQQRFGEAIVAAREAIDLEPGSPRKFVHLAGLLARTDDLARALILQREAVYLQPEELKFRVVLSDLLARQGRLDEALIEARIAAEHHPESTHALGHLAHITRLLGASEQAESLLRKAVAVEPQHRHWQEQFANPEGTKGTTHAG